MNPVNENETKKVLAILYPLWRPEWQQNEIDTMIVRAYAMAFQGQNYHLLQQAAGEWLQSEKWFPKPAELIGLASDIAYHDKGRVTALSAGGIPRANVNEIKRVLRKLVSLGYTRTHPNNLAVISGGEYTNATTSVPIPEELLAELRGESDERQVA